MQPIFRISLLIGTAIGCSGLVFAELPQSAQSKAPIKIGWIGPLTGSLAKWGSYNAALLAKEDIEASGGVNGTPVQFIFEDGKGQGRDAISAARKLLDVDRVDFLLAGQCSPESLAIAPIAQRAGTVMLASVTSTPYLSSAGDDIFRVTAVSTVAAEKLFDYALHTLGASTFAILYEEADYPRPQAERFRELISTNGKALLLYEGISRDESDPRTILTKVRARQPDAVFIATISPDVATTIMRQLRDLGIKSHVLGNENTGFAFNSAGAYSRVFNGVYSATSRYDRQRGTPKRFFERYTERYGVDALPYGPYTAEAYDAAMLLIDVLRRCGHVKEDVKRCLYETRDYDGAPGRFSIDSNGDATRDYQVLRVVDGKIQLLD